MSTITVPKIGGLALMIGAVLYIVATFLTPGYLIGGEGASDLPGVVDAITDNPLLTDFAALMGGAGIMFLLWGLIVMWQTAQSECALDTFVKFGLVGVMMAIVALLIAQCLNYTTSHVVVNGIGAGSGPDQTETLRATALQLQTIAGSARVIASLAGSMGYVVLGFALARKFRPGAYKILAMIVGVGAVVSLISLVFAEPFHDLITALAPVFLGLSVLYLVWWIVIGIGVYQERFGLRIGVTPEH